MTRLVDSKCLPVNIEMHVWNGSSWGEDLSNDFFCVGSLPYSNEFDAYVVPDVCYCTEYAEDWEAYIGDFFDPIEKSDRLVHWFWD